MVHVPNRPYVYVRLAALKFFFGHVASLDEMSGWLIIGYRAP